MATGTYVLSVDWNNDGDFSDTGENITARTMKCEWRRGSSEKCLSKVTQCGKIHAYPWLPAVEITDCLRGTT